jgi:rod shape-determining protein MreD
MIMRTGQQLLLPANPFFIWASLLMAMLLNFAISTSLGRAVWAPDIVALVLVFWAVHQPRRIGIGVAFLLGVCMDVQQSALLGQHAWSYTVMCFGAIAMHRRLLWFSVPSQAVQVLPLFIAAHALQILVRFLGSAAFPGVGVIAAPLLEAVLWPIVSIALLAPQRRAPDPDANRPL